MFFNLIKIKKFEIRRIFEKNYKFVPGIIFRILNNKYNSNHKVTIT